MHSFGRNLYCFFHFESAEFLTVPFHFETEEMAGIIIYVDRLSEERAARNFPQAGDKLMDTKYHRCWSVGAQGGGGKIFAVRGGGVRGVKNRGNREKSGLFLIFRPPSRGQGRVFFGVFPSGGGGKFSRLQGGNPPSRHVCKIHIFFSARSISWLARGSQKKSQVKSQEGHRGLFLG